jgi:hypothetical protein
MTVTITAVPAVPAGIETPPAPSSVTERPLVDFVSSPHNGPPDLANPAALASELFGSLRGYFERAQTFEKTPRMAESGSADGNDRAGTTPASMGGDPRADLHGGPARENLERADAYGGASPAVGVSLAHLRRVEELALASVNFATETTLVSGGTAQLSRSVNTLLKGQ